MIITWVNKNTGEVRSTITEKTKEESIEDIKRVCEVKEVWEEDKITYIKTKDGGFSLKP